MIAFYPCPKIFSELDIALERSFDYLLSNGVTTGAHMTDSKNFDLVLDHQRAFERARARNPRFRVVMGHPLEAPGMVFAHAFVSFIM